MRFLDREHDLMLRDLGGLVYEVHRTAAGQDDERHRQLVAAKLHRLSVVDAERAAAASVLGRADTDLVLREPGIGGFCPRCGEIYGSDAHYCSACGFPVTEQVLPPAPAGGSATRSTEAETPPAGTGDVTAGAVPAVQPSEPDAPAALDTTTVMQAPSASSADDPKPT